MKVFKEMKWDALMTGALYVVLGLVSLVIPETMEKTIGYLIGSVLIVAGAVSMISYLLRDAHQNYYHNDFYHGLIAIGAGIMVLVKVEIIIALIPFLLGVMVLISGCSKLQDVIDMKRTEYGNWIVMLVFAAVNLLIGILLIVCPIESAHLLFRLLGLGLIFSGITDCVITIYFANKIRIYLESLHAVDSSYVEINAGEARADRKANPTEKPKANEEPRTGTEPKANAEPRTGTESKANAEPRTGAEPKTGTEPKTATEPKTDTVTKADTEPGKGAAMKEETPIVQENLQNDGTKE